MAARAPILGVILCIAVLSQPFCYALRSRPQDKERQLAAKIAQERNPGKKARLQIRLARLKLTEAIHAYDQNNFDRGKALLQAYRREIDLSWKTLEDSRHGVAKHVRAYMKLEISLREDGRLLEDLRRRVPYPQSESVKAIAEENSRVHSQVLGVLFPPGTSPEKSKKLRRRGALRAGTPAVQA